jgi:hypothetical protein
LHEVTGELAMSIVLEDPAIEAIARKLAAVEGVSVEEVVREGLVSLAGRRGIAANDRPLRERLAALAREVDALPPSADPRTADEVVGYDAHGQW